jgi:hypothetical protein
MRRFSRHGVNQAHTITSEERNDVRRALLSFAAWIQRGARRGETSLSRLISIFGCRQNAALQSIDAKL